MNDLGLVPTDVLLAELFTRFSAAIFAGREQDTPDATAPERDAARYMYIGSPLTCIGLSQILNLYLLNQRDVVIDSEDV